MLVNLNDVLKDAQKRRYGVGLFNAIDSDMMDAIISTAEENGSPVILGTAEVLLPYGDFKTIAPSMLSRAKAAKVPIVVHFDHGLTFDNCIQALKWGFSSIMFDGSAYERSKNVEATREMVKIAHAFGASVEGEIGHVGEAVTGDNETDDRYTTVKEATDYIDETGVDALAIAIGTAHGMYKQPPKLDFNRLTEIRNATDVPLVLHGGSGLSDYDFRHSIECGITKINIFTDLANAGEAAMKEGIEKGLSYMDIRSLRKQRLQETVRHKLELFGSIGKA
ncbi:MAG: class II fructose-bisphosphate aldolase [Clostridia bacterium]|nr:class II fructose-bisphosphate aldolase [Clostridia bacterium]